MATRARGRWQSEWSFILGRPSERDIDYYFINDISAYVLVGFMLSGEC